MRELEDREDQNIFNLEMDEMVNDLPEVLQKEVILLRALNSLSPRSFSFINPAFLGSLGRSVKVL